MAAKPVVALYGRPGCTLCDEAAAMLADLEGSLGFETVRVNIEEDDALLRRFMFEIPVVVVDEVEIARAPIHRRGLEQALRDSFRPVT
ncbi:MAG TPA: glutaredoxin family protein [Tepidiformaceae bacterium]|nr:glutaredoxin family protein [Tepidiformaceae bacterium]